MIIKGDLNGDGRIDAQDLLLLQLIMLEALNPNEHAKLAGDVNGDGNITLTDLGSVQRHLMGLRTINEVIY